jgi:hypothetical protein
MTDQSGVRYSQGKKEIGDAKKFSWEHPVPDNKFWNDLQFVVGRNFLQSFTPEELDTLPIDPESSQSQKEKLELLLSLLETHLATKEASSAPQSYYDVAYESWASAWLGIFTMQHELGRPGAEDTIRMMIDRRQNKANLSHQHTLTGILLEKGNYSEAEQSELPVRDWLDGRLGKDSPQALGARRMIAEAMWKQGPARQEEAKKLLQEVREIIDGSAEGTFAVYQDEQKEMTEKLIQDLESWSP